MVRDVTNNTVLNYIHDEQIFLLNYFSNIPGKIIVGISFPIIKAAANEIIEFAAEKVAEETKTTEIVSEENKESQ